MRKILRYELAGATLIGTLHEPVDGRARAERGPRRVGLLLVNFAQSPRAGVGDLSAWLGDAAAAHGVPVFRFDLPGLGDSRGDTPRVGQPLWEFIREGGHTKWTSALIDRLRNDHGLDSFVVGGLCAGAVTAMYTAAQCRDATSGLILLEPVFHQCDESPEQDPIRVGASSATRNQTNRGSGSPESKGRSAWLRGLMMARLPQGRTLRIARNLYARYKRTRDVLRTGGVAADANQLVLQSWRQLKRARMPILMVNGAVDGREAYNRYYLGGDFHRHVTWAVVRATNHMLAANGGREGVTAHVIDWLDREIGTD